jgi:hypothetical protein
MPDAEGVALHLAARRAVRSGLGPLVEIGSYRGRSTLYIAAALAAGGSRPFPGPRWRARAPAHTPRLYSVDHHRGSEEMQPGWEHHDASIVDPATGLMDSLPAWRRAVHEAGAEDLVIGIVGESAAVAADWAAPLSLVFIDGGHGRDVAWADYRGWAPRVAPGGMLVLHDVFPDPADGGRPPYECFVDALASGVFTEECSAGRGSLRVLRRRVGGHGPYGP